MVDTVVLRYFLFVDRFDLLLTGLGRPLSVPRIVYDPDEVGEPSDTSCEIARSIHYQETRAVDARLSGEDRAQAQRNAHRLKAVAQLHRKAALRVLDLDADERTLLARLTDPGHVEEFGLLFPLDPGEAACLAIATHRGLTLATDDSDALAVLKRLAPDHPYQRIRKLLRSLADAEKLTKQAANELHAEMMRLNFWDREPPFPNESGGSSDSS